MKFVNRTNHATKDCRFKSNFKSCQPWSRVQAHLIEEEMNDDEYIGDEYHEGDSQNDNMYDDVL